MFWRVIIGVLLLLWVLGVAYFQARRRGRRIGLALFFLAGGVLCFLLAAFSPRPPLTIGEAQALIVLSVVLLALAVSVVLLRGFRG